MDSGWTMDPCDKSEPEKALLIKSKTFLNIFTFGIVSRLLDDSEPGFWFFVVRGTRLHLSGRW